MKNVRKSFWRALKRARVATEIRAAGNKLQLVVGAGHTRYDGWIHTEIDTLDILQEEQWQHWFQPASISYILAEHVWEHLTPELGLAAARNCYSFLRPNGHLRVAIPDGHNPDTNYINYVKPGGNGPGALDHKVLFTYRSLEQLLSKAGFEVKLLEFFDEGGEFHFSDWDPADGMVERSRRYDARNEGGNLKYTSLIADGIRP
jgi:predicted SAM-dependent methyltransferase